MSIPQTPSPLSNILAAKTYNAAWFSGSTKEAQITAAIAAAVLDGALNVYIPASMLPYTSSSVTFNNTIKMIAEGGDFGVYDVQAYGSPGNGTLDDVVAINAASAAATLNVVGGIVKYRRGTYLVGSTVNIPNNVRFVGDGMGATVVRRIFAGPIFRFTIANLQGIEHMKLDGNAQNATMVDFPDNGFYSNTRNVFLTNYTGIGYSFGNDSANASIHENIFFEPTGSQAIVPGIMFGTDSGPTSRRFMHCIVLNGNPLADFASAELVYMHNSAGQHLIFSNAASKKVLLGGCRIANQTAITVKGINHSIVGNVFGIADVILDSTTNTCTFDSNVVTNVSDLGTTNKIGLVELAPNPVTYSISMTPDLGKGGTQTITATNGTAFTINAPANSPITGGKTLTITIRNTSGGGLGVATWNAIYKMRAWVQPANGFSRSIEFRFDGSNWIELTRAEGDVPN